MVKMLCQIPIFIICIVNGKIVQIKLIVIGTLGSRLISESSTLVTISLLYFSRSKQEVMVRLISKYKNEVLLQTGFPSLDRISKSIAWNYYLHWRLTAASLLSHSAFSI